MSPGPDPDPHDHNPRDHAPHDHAPHDHAPHDHAPHDHSAHDEVTARTAATEATMEPQSVPVNMWEATDALVVVAPFPAVSPEDVTIELRDGCLRLWSRLRTSGPREYLLHEWQYGGFEREIDLPAGFGASVEATMANGQLAVRILRGDAVDLSVHPTPAGSHT